VINCTCTLPTKHRYIDVNPKFVKAYNTVQTETLIYLRYGFKLTRSVLASTYEELTFDWASMLVSVKRKSNSQRVLMQFSVRNSLELTRYSAEHQLYP
jgi:hypothetical protein